MFLNSFAKETRENICPLQQMMEEFSYYYIITIEIKR